MAYSVINTVTNTASGSTSLVINKPASVLPGDLLIAAINGNNFTPSTPSGFSVLLGSSLMILMYRYVDGSEGSSFTWTSGATQNWTGILTAIRGSDPHWGNSQTNQSSGFSTSVPFSSINPPGGGLVVVGLGENSSSAAISAWPPSNGFTSIANITNGGDSACALAYKAELPPTLLGINNVTVDANVFNWRNVVSAFYKQYVRQGVL